ncbi:ABC transporter permease subunit [bacterium]|nr:ABC transporter permease subunit [bacterium]
MNAQWLIARSVLIEAVRRREIYALVLVSTLLIGAVMTVDFFKLEGLNKFYREVALQIMSAATALTVIVLAARQLPREFETRTIYPLLAKPISRFTFLNGKLLGVMLAAGFCFALFMGIYLVGVKYIGGDIPAVLFLQYVYLQMLKMLILATMSFWLSMLMNLDAAITIGVIFFATASVMMNAFTFIYPEADPLGKWLIVALNWLLPQLDVLDLTEKAVHAGPGGWQPLSIGMMGMLTGYALVYTAIFHGLAFLTFRRRAL